MGLQKLRTNCKYCGGTLKIPSENSSIVECEYCGMMQSGQMVDDDAFIERCNRANKLRMDAQFDRASSIYESICSVDLNNAEANWCLCLCRYGVEYVDDPKTKKKIPTCHRTLLKSIFEDPNYLRAIENSNPEVKKLYQREAAYIDVIQQKIYKIVKSEEPYDIFICYKEEDEYNCRTTDSEYAENLYYKLSDMGYKVFFAKKTLQSKLGEEFEPYIYSALLTAKIMILLSFNKNYLNAPWVRNEWKRYVDMMHQSPEKKIIGCFHNLDPGKDYPMEIRNIQAIEFDSFSWETTLLKNIEKNIPLNPNTQQKKDYSDFVKQKLEEAVSYLKRSEFKMAEECYNKVLNVDERNGDAYIGLALSKKSICGFSNASACEIVFNQFKEQYGDQVKIYSDLKNSDTYVIEFFGNNLKRAFQFLDSTKKHEVKKQIHELSLSVYNSYIELKKKHANQFKKDGEFGNAIELFKGLSNVFDCIEQLQECYYLHGQNLLKNGDYSEAQKCFIEAKNYKDSELWAEKANQLETDFRNKERLHGEFLKKYAILKDKYINLMASNDEDALALRSIAKKHNKIASKNKFKIKWFLLSLLFIIIGVVCYIRGEADTSFKFRTIENSLNNHEINYMFWTNTLIIAVMISSVFIFFVLWFQIGEHIDSGAAIISIIAASAIDAILCLAIDIIDQYVLGRFADNALSGIANSFTLQFIIYIVFFALIASIPIIRYIGNNNKCKRLKGVYDNKFKYIHSAAMSELERLIKHYNCQDNLNESKNDLSNIIFQYSFDKVIKISL